MPLSYKLHSELAIEHNGPQRWGYREVKCGSVEAVVSRNRIEQLQKQLGINNGNGSSSGDGKDWEKLPKQTTEAKELMRKKNVPEDLDWIDADVITGYSEMGMPGATETAQVHPYHFTTSIGELARSGGTDVKLKAKVTDIKTSPDGLHSVSYLERDADEAKDIQGVTDVVVAAGPWTGRVLPRSKVEGLRAHSVVYDADVSAHAVFTDIQLPQDFIPEHRAKMGQKRRHKGGVDPEMYARPFGEVYACGELSRNTLAHDDCKSC